MNTYFSPSNEVENICTLGNTINYIFTSYAQCDDQVHRQSQKKKTTDIFAFYILIYFYFRLRILHSRSYHFIWTKVLYFKWQFSKFGEFVGDWKYLILVTISDWFKIHQSIHHLSLTSVRANGQWHSVSISPIFMSSFFVQKLYAQLFCTWSLDLYFSGPRKLYKKVPHKCCWNWHQAVARTRSSTFVKLSVQISILEIILRKSRHESAFAQSRKWFAYPINLFSGPLNSQCWLIKHIYQISLHRFWISNSLSFLDLNLCFNRMLLYNRVFKNNQTILIFNENFYI